MPSLFSASDLGRYAVMGVVNVTPDSFSDGGRFLDRDAAVRHGCALAASGASMIDVGGESTRPGAEPVAADVEAERVVPVIERLAAEVAVPISVDTTKSGVADAALVAGASLVNDVSAATRDAEMIAVVAGRRAGLVLMHSKGEPATMQVDPRYDDVLAEVAAELAARVDAATAAGVERDAVLADPGIGFGKTRRHNLELLASLPALGARLGVPLVLGTSRKSLLGQILGGAPASARDEATLATTVWAFRQGVRMVRVHDVESSVRAARLLDVLDRATPDGLVPGVAA